MRSVELARLLPVREGVGYCRLRRAAGYRRARLSWSLRKKHSISAWEGWRICIATPFLSCYHATHRLTSVPKNGAPMTATYVGLPSAKVRPSLPVRLLDRYF